MLLIKLIFSSLGPILGLTLVRLLPRSWAYGIGDWIVGILVTRPQSDLYRAVRSNQAVIRGWSYADDRLHAIVQDVLTQSARDLVDWFAILAIRAEFERLECSIDENLVEAARLSGAEGRGVIIVGGHLSGYNMIMMKIAQERWPVQILSYAEEAGSYQSDNLFRKRFGLEVTPISPGSLRKAYQRLKTGGFVLTGVDRPDTGGELLTFFGRPAVLPIGHARLALRTGARIMLVMIQKTGSGGYNVTGSVIKKPEGAGDGIAGAREWAQEIADHLEGCIRQRPSEWLMFVPAWPEALP